MRRCRQPSVEGQGLHDARGYYVRHIKGGGAFIGGGGIGILRGGGLAGAVGDSLDLADDGTGVVERFGKRIVGLKTDAQAGRSFLDAGLQRMIGGV